MVKTKVKVNLNGTECNILSDENESYVRSVATEVDEAIRKTTIGNPGLPKSIINALVMMDFCDKARKANDSLQNLDIRMKECLETAVKNQMMAEKLKEDNDILNRRLSRKQNQAKTQK
jgi:cell division protein ZapA (FtsZ GTPase activity inhibitor)